MYIGGLICFDGILEVVSRLEMGRKRCFFSRLSAVRCLYLATSFGITSAVRFVAVRMGVVGCLVGRKESADYPIDAGIAFSLVEYSCVSYHDFVCIVCLYWFVQYLGTCGTETGGSDATSHVMLPIVTLSSVLLLGIGIFIGAVWANVSWGSYWTWDPKEVWALITF